MRIHRPTFSILAALLALATVAGCVKHDGRAPPAAFPAIDAKRMPGNPACPDVTGVFSSVVAEGSDAALARIGGLSEPRSSTIQLMQEGASVRVATWWPSKAVWSEASALSHRDGVLYRIWWNAAREVLSGEVSPGSAAVARASSVPDPTAVRTATWVPECVEGWLPYATSIFLARDVEGGLLVRHDEEVDRVEIPLMCGGDGCAGIPLYTRIASRWARYPPSTLPATWTMDFAALPVPEGVAAGVGDAAGAPEIGSR